MRRFLIAFVLVAVLVATMVVPTWAVDTMTGPDAGTFGKPTSVEAVTVIGRGTAEVDNINRSKDSAIIPPPFGSPASNERGTGEALTPGISGVGTNTEGYTVGASGNSYVSSDSGYPASTDSGTTYSNHFTLPDGMYYSDGSIGTLSIKALGLSVKVYESEDLETLKKGVGHFKSSSAWDGNVCFAGHNRGVNDYFGEIHTLRLGSEIKYSTIYGTRTYEVVSVTKVKETDLSVLDRTNGDQLTLVTCVKNQATYRWCVVAREVPN